MITTIEVSDSGHIRKKILKDSLFPEKFQGKFSLLTERW
jgi:hypothetical protein